MAGNGFNAFDYAAELKKAGVPDNQAELQARALAQLQDSTSATKQDLELTKLELKRDIEAVRAELKHDIEGVRAELKGDIKQLEIGLEKIHRRSKT